MLKRVSIQNFKSLKDVTLDLQKVNLLIGPNNSGKTNFLKALEFFASYVEGGQLVPAKDHYKKDVSNLIEINFYSQNTDDKYIHVFLNRDDEQSKGISYSTYIVYSRDSKFEDQYNSAEDLMKGEFQEIFGPCNIYKPDSNKLTHPSIVGTGEEIVNSDASNVVGFLDLMLGKYRRTVFNRIETDINTCIPEFNEVKIEDALHVTEELRKLFGDRTFKRIGLSNSEQDITYWADELSEGTLYFLALLCIINQPNPPKLLLLEEPEKGIHPRRIREVMNFVRRLVSEKDIQVIMTTHSPLLLDEFAESPESVFVFDKDEEGATIVRNLQRDVIEPANQENERLGIPPVPYTEALGEYWTIGFLGGVPHEAA